MIGFCSTEWIVKIMVVYQDGFSVNQSSGVDRSIELRTLKKRKKGWGHTRSRGRSSPKSSAFWACKTFRRWSRLLPGLPFRDPWIRCKKRYRPRTSSHRELYALVQELKCTHKSSRQYTDHGSPAPVANLQNVLVEKKISSWYRIIEAS